LRNHPWGRGDESRTATSRGGDGDNQQVSVESSMNSAYLPVNLPRNLQYFILERAGGDRNLQLLAGCLAHQSTPEW